MSKKNVHKYCLCNKKILPHLYVSSYSKGIWVYYCLECWKLTPAGNPARLSRVVPKDAEEE